MYRVIVAALLSLSLGIPGTASAAGPLIVDQAGDANGLNGQWYDPAMIGQIARAVRDGVFSGDPFGEGRGTPESYEPADIRSVTLETEYSSTAVGQDGLRHIPTGLRIRVRTEEPVAAPHGSAPLTVNLLATLGSEGGCSSAFHVDVSDSGALSGVRWFRWEDCRWNYGTTWGGFHHPAWTATRSADPQEIVLRVPYSSLTGPERDLLAPGQRLTDLEAITRIPLVATFDVTLRASGFEVGSDLPADVPCTRGCPGD